MSVQSDLENIITKSRTFKIKKLNTDAVIPKYNLAGDAGFDLSSSADYVVLPQQTVLVKTGLAFEIPVGNELQVRPRSGLSIKSKLRISNSPGTVDSNYRGEVGIIVDNIGHTPHFIKKGDRIAQGVICPVVTVEFVEVEELDETNRGDKGFGSSGV